MNKKLMFLALILNLLALILAYNASASTTSDYIDNTLCEGNSSCAYVIINATAITGDWTSEGSNLTKIGDNTWVFWNLEDSNYELNRANLWKTMLWGIEGSSTGRLDNSGTFSSGINVIATNDNDDIGRRGHRGYIYSSDADGSGSLDCTFDDTTTNFGCSAWGRVYNDQALSGNSYWKFPTATTIISTSSSGTWQHIGTDRSADEVDNPANCHLEGGWHSTSTPVVNVYGVFLCKGDITWIDNSGAFYAIQTVDYYTDNSIPLLTNASNSEFKTYYSSNITAPISGFELYNLNSTITFNYNINSTIKSITNYSFVIKDSDSIDYFKYTNNSVNLNLLSSSIDIGNLTDDSYTVYLESCLADSTCFNSTSNNLLVNSTKVIEFNGLNYLGELISEIWFYSTGVFGTLSAITDTYTVLVSTFINDSSQSLNITMNFTDLTYANIDGQTTFNITGSTNSYNYSLDPIQLSLQFTQNGTAYTATGEICEGGTFENTDWDDMKDYVGLLQCWDFVNSTFVQIQSELDVGNVYVKFNMNTTGNSDWKQYFEYYNDQETYISETLDVLNSADSFIYYQVTDNQNRPIEDAIVKVYNSRPNIINDSVLIGQRLTRADGTTMFFYDDTSTVHVAVYKEGYQPFITVIYPVDDYSEHDSRTSAQKLVLKKAEFGSTIGPWMGGPQRFFDRSEDMIFSVTTPYFNSVKYITTYYEGIGGSQKSASEGNLLNGYEYSFTLDSGLDFSASGSDDVIIQMYFDNINYYNWTVEYFEKEDLFNFDDINLDDDYVVVIGGIALILLSILVGWWIASSTAGVGVFLVGGIVLTIIDTSFMWLGIVNALMLIFLMIRRIFSE